MTARARPQTAAERQRKLRRERHALYVTLHSADAAALQRIIEASGETAADWVRRMVREQDAATRR
ncbi:MAG TPA: hypothetical protein VF216_03110 [Mizugakiibacter sp.]